MVDLNSKWKYIPIGAIIGVIATSLIFGYTEWYKPPFLTYEILKPYPLSPSEQVVSMILRNEGHDVASNVRVTVEAKGVITSVYFESPEEVSIVGNNTKKVIFTFSRIDQGIKITVFLRITSDSDSLVEEIWITSDQCPGHLYDPNRLKFENVLFWVLGSCLGLGVIWILFIVWRSVRYRTFKRAIMESIR